MAVLPERMTLEEFLKLPETKPYLEFEDGRVLEKVSPKVKHSAIQYALAERFNRLRGRQKVVRAFPELRATYGGRSYIPDVSVYLLGRLPLDPDGRFADDLFEPPDLAIEIVSPEQRVNALVRRCLWYMANGVKIALLVDPRDESVLVFRPNQVPQPVPDTEKIDLTDLVPGFEFPANDIFGSLRIR